MESGIDMQGIQLQFLLSWATNKNIPPHWTTADVLSNIVLPETTPFLCSYCDYVKKEENNSPIVGASSAFISYAWSCRFMDVLKALETHFASNLEICVWIDIMCFNQHKVSNIDVNWVQLLKSAIKDIGRTVMVLAPWNDPTPLHRAWCVWELYCTIIGKKEGKCQFEIALSPESEEQCFEQIQNNTHEVIGKMLAIVDSKKSTCLLMKDQELIHTVIGQSIGYNELNKEIFELMRKWIIDKYSQRLQFLRFAYGNTDPRTLKSIAVLGSMYLELGDPQSAEPLLKECFEVKEATLGFNHVDTLTSMNNLGVLYSELGKYEIAESLVTECLELKQYLFGEHHEDCLISMHNLGYIYLHQGKYQLAEPLLKECLKLHESIFGEKHRETLRTMYILACLYGTLEKYELAEPLLIKSREVSEEVLGKNHPVTLLAMESLGNVYGKQNNFKLAESLHKESLLGISAKFGKNHPYTLTAMHDLAMCYDRQGNYELAEPLFKECLQLRTALIGKNHPLTVSERMSLANLYCKQKKPELAASLLKEFRHDDRSHSQQNDSQNSDNPVKRNEKPDVETTKHPIPSKNGNKKMIIEMGKQEQEEQEEQEEVGIIEWWQFIVLSFYFFIVLWS